MQAKRPAVPIADVSGGVLEYVRGDDPISNPGSDIGRPISDSAATVNRADLVDTQNQRMAATGRDPNHTPGTATGLWQATDSDPLVREVTERLHAVAVNCMAAMEANPPYRMEDPPCEMNDSHWRS